MLMNTRVSTLTKPDDYRKDDHGYRECCKYAYEHLIFSLFVQLDKFFQRDFGSFEDNVQRAYYSIARKLRDIGHTLSSTSFIITSTSDSGTGRLSSFKDQTYNSAASFILARASWIVSPCEAHPGRAGIWTEYPPSCSCSRIALNFFSINLTPIISITQEALGVKPQ